MKTKTYIDDTYKKCKICHGFFFFKKKEEESIRKSATIKILNAMQLNRIESMIILSFYDLACLESRLNFTILVRCYRCLSISGFVMYIAGLAGEGRRESLGAFLRRIQRS